ncbi:mucoidy inhibitor MuiA family protein [Rhabdaerophilum sp. SD176]|uniref:mucoidy inhibitor MuiA family protein n=1 Tax=Rhabdaerophilum sp. SD176 TaxID=2983548 RepID=UPI0024DFF252|nr:mucoidy inhibitor MuiA family protein [Rhabdaerophilum sp. SD176]
MTPFPRLALLMAGIAPIALAASPAFAATIDAPSRLQDVTVYPDAATVRRMLEIDIPAGEHELRIDDLPAMIDPASLRVEGEGSDRLVIGNVDLSSRARTGEAGKPETRQKLAALRRERDRLQDRIDAAEGKKQMIQRAGSGEGSQGKPLDPDQWMKAWDLVGKGLQGVNEEMRGLRDSLEKVEAEMAVLEQESARIAPRHDTARVAMIAVQASASLRAKLTLTYRVNAAGWRPVYDARLSTQSGQPQFEWVRRAMIRQQTGEDWANARVTLSTVMVRRGTQAPDLRGEKIAFWERPVPRSAPVPMSAAPVPEAMVAGQLRMDAARKEAPGSDRNVAAEEAQARMETGGFQTEFRLPGTVTLPSGMGERSVRLGADRPDIKLTLRSAPVLDPTAYLDVSFRAAGEAPILPGEVLLTRDGAFVGKGRVPLVAPGDQARLGFGADDRVTVRRVPVSRQAREPGLLGSTRTEDSQFRTVVKNLHAFPVEIHVEDRIPVSEDQAITVERLPEMTKPDLEAPDDRRGVVAWTLALKPQEERALVTAYRLRWPAAKEIRPLPLPR